jgi:dipeptidyl-peptidase-4
MDSPALPALPAQLVRTRLFTRGAPSQFTVTRDGSAVLFLRSRAGDDPVSCLWVMDAAAGTERLLADPAVLADEPGAGITAYATDDAGTLAAFAMRGVLYTANAANGEVHQLPTPHPASGPLPAPDGRAIVYTSGGTLWISDATDRLLAAPDGPEASFGAADAAGSIVLNGSRGFWWSPDGTRLLVARVDSSPVQTWYLSNPAEPGTRPTVLRYPTAGTPNAAVSLWIIDLDGRRVRVLPLDAEYIPRAGWDAHGPYALAQSRDQRTVRFLEIDPDSGKTAVRFEQHDDCWVQLVPGLPARTASGTLLAHADIGDTRRLTAGGVPVTPPGLQLRDVLGTDRDDVLFTASDDPAERHLWTYRPGDGVQPLTNGHAVYSGTRRGGTLVDVKNSPDGIRTRVTRESRGPVLVTDLSERPVLTPRPRELSLGPRGLRALLYLPSWYRPGGRKLPVLACPYGGADRQRVHAGLEWRSAVDQWFAEQGFAVLVADGRGTPGRGPVWEREVHGDMFGPVLDDQVTAVREAGRLNADLDMERVGISGWSFAGALAALAVLRRPDVFRAAVAGAGVMDARLHNTHWRERFLGHPDEFPRRYEAASPVHFAAGLARPLLLIHGLADTNVPVANTLRMSSALLAAGRPHEVILMPGVGHPSMGPGVPANLLKHQADFLLQHLG